MNTQDARWIEVSQSALEHNSSILTDKLDDGVLFAPCIKANAYGHGLVGTARILEDLGADWLCVFTADEAIELKKTGIDLPILMLGMAGKKELKELIERRVRLIVPHREYVSQVEVAAQEAGEPAYVHAKIDTGMNRFGVHFSDAGAFLEVLRELSNIHLEGVMSHFSTADEEKDDLFKKQLKRFKQLANEAEIAHCANSATLLREPSAHFDLVRPGIAVYGYDPSTYIRTSLSYEELMPALSMKTRIAQIKRISPGSSIGYGATFTAETSRTIAILPVGYYDGVDRLLSNTGAVLIEGECAPIVGRVCMNIIMVDITNIDTAKVGTVATLIGAAEEESITADDIAHDTGTISYEVISRLRESIPRYYVD